MYIKNIEIKNLWGFDFTWELAEDVNVLIGQNGLGKSTILQILYEAVFTVDDNQLNYRIFDPIDEIIIEFNNNSVVRVDSNGRSITNNGEITDYNTNITFINTFDVVEKSIAPNKTFLDYTIDKLKQQFFIYQRDLSEQVEKALREGNRTEIDRIISSFYEPKKRFLTSLETFFSDTEKTFDEKDFCFYKKGIQTSIPPEKLSSGEKQVLIIFLTALLSDDVESIILMDEPEISLGVEWQRTLLKNVRDINPKCQIILVTHSPTIFYQGWLESVKRIEEIRSETVTASKILNKKTEQAENRLGKIKAKFAEFADRSKLNQLYKFNNEIKLFTSLTNEECVELLKFLRKEEIYPDIFTFTILISKINNYADAKAIFDMIENQKYTKLTHVKPNQFTLNTLIKKITKIEEGLELLQEISSDEKQSLQLYPDIITFSTLLGKAKNAEEIRLIDETRAYFGVQTNDIYNEKFNLKR